MKDLHFILSISFSLPGKAGVWHFHIEEMSVKILESYSKTSKILFFSYCDLLDLTVSKETTIPEKKKKVNSEKFLCIWLTRCGFCVFAVLSHITLYGSDLVSFRTPFLTLSACFNGLWLVKRAYLFPRPLIWQPHWCFRPSCLRMWSIDPEPQPPLSSQVDIIKVW